MAVEKDTTTKAPVAKATVAKAKAPTTEVKAKAPVTEGKAKTEEKKPRGRQRAEGPTINSVAIEAIKAGMDNDEALAEVLKHFPEAKTKKASINWYRNKIREEDSTVKTSRDITKARNAVKKAAAKEAKAKEKAEAKASAEADGKSGADVDPTK